MYFCKFTVDDIAKYNHTLNLLQYPLPVLLFIVCSQLGTYKYFFTICQSTNIAILVETNHYHYFTLRACEKLPRRKKSINLVIIIPTVLATEWELKILSYTDICLSTFQPLVISCPAMDKPSSEQQVYGDTVITFQK